jgi:hypothetical protein
MKGTKKQLSTKAKSKKQKAKSKKQKVADFWQCSRSNFPRLFLLPYLPKLDDSKAQRKLRMSSFRKGQMETSIPSRWRVMARTRHLSPAEAVSDMPGISPHLTIVL